MSKKFIKKKLMTYAIYDSEENIVCVGNADDCCRFLNISHKYFYSKFIRVGTKKYKIYKIGVTDYEETGCSKTS